MKFVKVSYKHAQAGGSATKTAFLRARTPQIPVSSRADCPGKMSLPTLLADVELETLFFRPTFANRDSDGCGANSSSGAACCGAAYGTHDTSCVVPLGNARRHGPRGRPSCGSHGGPDHRFAPGRCLLEVWDGP